jgi:hypothetical protein
MKALMFDVSATKIPSQKSVKSEIMVLIPRKFLSRE